MTRGQQADLARREERRLAQHFMYVCVSLRVYVIFVYINMICLCSYDVAVYVEAVGEDVAEARKRDVRR